MATTWEIEKEYLGKHFANPSIKGVKYIAIDELATKKGQVCMTVVLDLETGYVLFVGEGKDQSALLPFWKRIRRCRVQIKAVATDMSPAYTAAVKEHLPNAVHVHDRFHVVKMFNDVISKVRRTIAAKIKDKDEKSELKGIRFILLKRPENLDRAKGEPQRRKRTLKANEDLATLYYLKEELHSLWDENEESAAQGKLLDLIAFMESTQLHELKGFARCLGKHARNILNWYTHHITTGRLEGVNNKIKTLKRQAYGFRDMEYFKLKILALART